MAKIDVKLPLDVKKKKPSKFIGVWSAKGGVGKTVVAVNLAYALKALSPEIFGKSLKVGLLDADIDAPNVTTYLGINAPLVGSAEENVIYPYVHNGVEVVSMGMIKQQNKSLAWRGPLLTQAIEQLVYRVKWHSDVVVVDLPPGTSDIPLTLMHDIGLDALILVTAPSKLAIEDLLVGKDLAERFSLPILAVVENFVGDVFPSKKAEIEKLVSPVFELPLAKGIAEAVEEGELFFAREEAAPTFRALVTRISAFLKVKS